MQNLSAPLALCFKLINTLSSKSFEMGLRMPWTGAGNSENIQAIQKKATSDLQRTRDRFLESNDVSKVLSYLDHLQVVKEIKLKKSEQKGLIRSLELNNYCLLNDFICNVSAAHRPFGELQSAQFECHELIRAVMDYFLMKDTVENGTGHSGLDEIVQNLLNTKPVSFFENGYNQDLFICDRLFIINGEGKKPYTIRCHKNYLSTYILGKQGNPEDDKHYDFYKVA